MKDKNDNEIGVWNDPELEARLVAMLMGELSAYEEAEMEEELKGSPELRFFRDRMEEVMGLISEVGEQVEDEGGDDEWKMDGERRGGLLEKISSEEAVEAERVEVVGGGVQWRNLLSVAACLLISVGAFVMMFLRRGEVYRNQEELITYSVFSEEEEEIVKPVLGENAWAFSQSKEKEDLVATREVKGKRREFLYPTEYEFDEEKITKPEMSNEAPQRPSAPGSSMAKVIAASPGAAVNIPVPDEMVGEPSLGFGDGGDFGDGWGGFSGGGSKGREEGKQLGMLTKYSEIKQSNTDELGFDWVVEPFNANSTRREAWSGSLEKDGMAKSGGLLSVTGVFKTDKLDLKNTDSYAAWDGGEFNKSNIVAGGNRSGDYAINGADIDGVLNGIVTGGATLDLAERYSGGKDDSRKLSLGSFPKTLDNLDGGKGKLFRSGGLDDKDELAKIDYKRTRMLMNVDAFGINEAKDSSLLVREKLADIKLPLMEFDEDATVKDAINFLSSRAKELDGNTLDPSKKGMDFAFRDAAEVDGGELVEAGKIEDIKLGGLKIRDVPMDEALRQIAQQTGLRYKVEEGVVTLLKATDVDDNEMYARTFRVPEGMVDALKATMDDGAGLDDDPFAGEDISLEKASVKDLLEMQGIRFPEGTTVGYSKDRGTLTVRNTAEGLDQVEELVEMVKKEEQGKVLYGFEVKDASALLPSLDVEGKGKVAEQGNDVWEEAIPAVEEKKYYFGRKTNALRVGGGDAPEVMLTKEEYDARRLAAIEEFKEKRREQEDKVEDHRTRLYALSKKLQIPYHGKDGRFFAGRGDRDAREYDRADQAYEEAKRTKDQLESFTESLEGLSGEDLAVTLMASGRPEAAVLRADYDEISRLKQAKSVAVAGGLATGHDRVQSLDANIKEVEERLERSQVNVRKKLKEDLVVFGKNVEKLRIDSDKEVGDLMVGAEEKTRFGKVREDYERELAVLEAIKGAEFNELLGENLDRYPVEVEKKVDPDFSKEISAAVQTHSTFSLNVSDVSYQLAKDVLLEKGGIPDGDKVRVEEFVNAFDYGDPGVSSASGSGGKVNCVVEQCAHPFYQQRNLVRLGVKTGAIGRSLPLRLTVLLDNSGSMERADRKATVLKAVEALARELGPEDEVTLLSFARGARLVAQRVKGDEAMKLVGLVRGIPSEGGTNLSRSIEEAYAIAKEGVKEGSMSRIVLITDGAANLGNADPEELSKSVERMRQQGIAFDACGVGADGLDDDMLEALTRKGDGRYYFINKPEDADAGFAQKLAGALRPAAQNVKVQVVFNPERVGNYRLVGFEKHRLKKQDFRNDAVDAAEMAAEEAGNALYQVEARADGSGDVGTVFVRFRDMASGEMVERSWVIPYEGNAASVSDAAASMQLAAVAGMLGERLKFGADAGIDLKDMRDIYGKLRGNFQADEEVQNLIRMCEKVIGY
ncbi:MAG: YfbK domain-containing protein [Akkermansiaceae bacterium]